MENKDLDIPTQKEMLALFRCGEIAREVYVEFEKHYDKCNSIISKKQRVKNLGEKSKSIIDSVMGKIYFQVLIFLCRTVQSKDSTLCQNCC